MAARLDVVTIGEAMVGLLADDGCDLTLSRRFERQVVGAEANVAIGLARLGRRVGFIGRVGADAFGDGLARGLRAEGIEVSHLVRDDQHATGVLFRDVCVDRPIQVAYYRSGSAGAALCPADIDEEYVADARLLHLTGITPILSDTAWAATRAAVVAAKRAGTVVAFDPNLRRTLCPDAVAVPRLREIVRDSDLLLVGLQELHALVGTGYEMQDAARVLLAEGPEVVVVKDGVRGCWAFDRDGSFHQPAWPVTALDPVGAGDAFAAGFIHAWLDAVPLPRALVTAAVTAALCASTRGDSTGLPFARDVAAVEQGAVDVRR